MKNYRNGEKDYGPPLAHKDPRPRSTKIGFGGIAITISWTRYGPMVLPAQSHYQPIKAK